MRRCPRAQGKLGCENERLHVTRVAEREGLEGSFACFLPEIFSPGTVTRVLLPCNLGRVCLLRGRSHTTSPHALHSGANRGNTESNGPDA